MESSYLARHIRELAWAMLFLDALAGFCAYRLARRIGPGGALFLGEPYALLLIGVLGVVIVANALLIGSVWRRAGRETEFSTGSST